MAVAPAKLINNESRLILRVLSCTCFRDQQVVAGVDGAAPISIAIVPSRNPARKTAVSRVSRMCERVDRQMHQPDDDVPFAADAEKISAIGRGSPSRG